MKVLDWFGGLYQKGVIAAVPDLAAAAIADWLDRNRITPELLGEAAAAGEDVMIEALKGIPPNDLRAAKAAFSSVAASATPKLYLDILAALEETHRTHVAAISPAHLDWYRAQMDKAREWLMAR
jgi:hypothetical protein